MSTPNFCVSDSGLECLIYNPVKPHTATILFLHGLGDNARNIGPLLSPLTQYPSLSHVKFILPTSPLMSVTGMKGRTIPCWFDVYSFDYVNRPEDEKGLYRAVGFINELISKEEKEYNIPSNRIIVGGLSQGGAVSIFTALTTERPLAGLFPLSTYIPLRKKVPEIATAFAKRIPIFWAHGTEDQQVDHDTWKNFAEILASQLSVPFITDTETVQSGRSGVQGLEFRSYQGLGHWIIDDELQDLATWASNLIPDTV
ncbi:Phospholipase/carboxylesterase/thioesterase [Flammula alnicola]|nr:Phospholipase/carboxylesterase/thioesterase [Flammula alnicola]